MVAIDGNCHHPQDAALAATALVLGRGGGHFRVKPELWWGQLGWQRQAGCIVVIIVHNTTYINKCDDMNRIIAVTMFLVMLFNACFIYQPKKDTNLLILALNRFEYGMTLTDDTFMNTLSKMFACIKLYKFRIICILMTFL